MSPWPHAIVLDLDGTLVDSFPGIALALDRALVALGRAPLGLDWVRRHVGRGLASLARDAVGDDTAAELVERFGNAYDEVLEASTPPFPGVSEALSRLAAGAALAVASNKPVRWSRRLVAHLGWDDLLPVVLGPEDAGAPKPDPAMVRLALDRIGAEPWDALLVGDMEVDAATGLEAGVTVVGVARDSRSGDVLLAAGAAAVIAGVAALPTWLAAHRHRFATAPPSRRRGGDRD